MGALGRTAVLYVRKDGYGCFETFFKGREISFRLTLLV